MSFALNWIQEAARLLKEAQRNAYDAKPNSPEWHTAVEELLKPKLPRYGE